MQTTCVIEVMVNCFDEMSSVASNKINALVVSTFRSLSVASHKKFNIVLTIVKRGIDGWTRKRGDFIGKRELATNLQSNGSSPNL
jgi:hypothetical protein